MKPNISKAKKVTYSERVEKWMRPYMPGKVNHPVYSTWAMIRGMECAARKLLQPYLMEGEDAVGCEVSVRHLLPTTIGRMVRITAEFKAAEGLIVTCRLEAFSGKRKIGEGTHKQYVMALGRYKKFLKES